ncbi:uncharacterized protein CXorf65 homolog [Phascolarctos cinereus]|uniref:Uncharacterized protein CXorf65 homolog isoform X2 n=1 Tax=Phascolarctos cinereus TaxID=38626 RepID=A0A6P5IZU3_PHACI|nr:uncharacterized protein CXorf65 homolog isoform X2 [Phascolarctos cinereus]
MFITILHGDHEKTLFNSHCKVEALLSSIKQCCGCEPEEMIELADESGQLKNLLQYPQLYASELLKPRETYIPFSVKRPEGSSEPVFVALLKDEVIDSKLLATLRLARNSNSTVSEKQPKPGKTKRKTVTSEARSQKAN